MAEYAVRVRGLTVGYDGKAVVKDMASSGGTGIPVYRALQRAGVPFAAGILYENDVDYRLSRLLAVETVSEKPFQAISDAALKRALTLIKAVPRVIDAGMMIGETNQCARTLIDEAKALDKYEEA